MLTPGVLAYVALRGRRGALETLALGWALGYALELAAFNLTAALDVRTAFLAFPLVVGAIAGPLAWRRRQSGSRSEAPAPLPHLAVVLTAAACALGIGYLAFAYFTIAPLPSDVDSVAYYPDFMYHVSIAAEAKHHWPLADPAIAGEGLRYHTFVHMHMAAVSQVAGHDLSVVLFRLLPVPLLVLMTLQLACLSRRLGPSAWAVPLTAALALCAGELDLDPTRVAPFVGQLFRGMFLSPSFLFGFAFFLAAVIMIGDRLADREQLGRGGWVALLLVLTAAAGAKVAVLPVLIGGLIVFLAWRALLRRRIDGVAARVLAVVVTVFAITYVALYVGGGQGGLGLGFLTALDASVIAELADEPFAGPTGTLLRILVAPAVLAAMMLPLAGLLWVLKERGLDLGPFRTWLVSLFLAGLFAGVFLSHPAAAQLYFLFYGYVAALPVGAEGLVLIWRRLRLARARPWRALAPSLAVVLAVGALAVVAAWSLPLAAWARYVLAYGALLLTVTAAVALVVLPSDRPRRGLVGGLTLFLLVSATALNAPFDHVYQPLMRVLGGQSLYTAADTSQLRGLDEGLYAGLLWIRENTEEDALLAVNNHYADPAETRSVFAYYSGLAERRVFLESWLYSPGSLALGYRRVQAGVVPYPEMLALNEAAFEEPSATTVGELADRGVTHLVVDKLNAAPAPELERYATPVFSNESVAIYEVG